MVNDSWLYCYRASAYPVNFSELSEKTQIPEERGKLNHAHMQECLS